MTADVHEQRGPAGAVLFRDADRRILAGVGADRDGDWTWWGRGLPRMKAASRRDAIDSARAQAGRLAAREAA